MAGKDELLMAVSELRKKLALFDTLSSDQSEFNTAKMDLTKLLESISASIIEASDAIVFSEGEASPHSDQPTPTKTIIDSIKLATASVVSMQDTLTRNTQ